MICEHSSQEPINYTLIQLVHFEYELPLHFPSHIFLAIKTKSLRLYTISALLLMPAIFHDNPWVYKKGNISKIEVSNIICFFPRMVCLYLHLFLMTFTMDIDVFSEKNY